MKKIFIIGILILLFSDSGSFGAVSGDVYVRQDVFDAKMEAFFNRIHSEIGELRGDIKALSVKIDEVDARLSAKIDEVDARLSMKIDGVDSRLSSRIDGLDSRISDLRNGFYLVSVLFGMLLGWPLFNKWQDEREKRREEARKSSLTIEDVERIFDAKISAFMNSNANKTPPI